jgi:signal transduction histidine kinase
MPHLSGSDANFIKPSNTKSLRVSLASENDWLSLAVIDDGNGFNPETGFPGHLGLFSVRERASNINAGLDITGFPVDGTQIRT